MQEYIERLSRPEMTYYRETYKDSPRWRGEPLKGKKLLVYCEQGMGDTIQFARYFKYLDAEIILHCQPPLMRLMKNLKDVNCSTYDKMMPDLPDHDLHTLSMSLPFLLNKIEVDVPYIHAWGKSDVLEREEKFKVGIAWEGNPENEMNQERSCSLNLFRDLPGIKYMLQDKIYSPEYIVNSEDMELYGVELNDMQDVAELIVAMDMVVTVDTAVLHLAGALGKKTAGLLCYKPDARWSVRNWYPSVKLFSQKKPGKWKNVFEEAKEYINESSYWL